MNEKVMRHYAAPLLVLALAYLFFIIFVLATSASMPARLATHFDAAGSPNAWMPRQAHVTFILGMGLTLPLLVPLICLLAGRFGASSLNIPRRDYWLAPERKDATLSFIVRHSLWFGVGFILFFASIQYSLVVANRQTPPHLPLWLILAAAGGFLLFVAAWSLRLLFYFLRRPRQ